MARAPESDDAAAAVGVALAALPPRAPAERVALARAMKFHGAAADARTQVARAVQGGIRARRRCCCYGELLTTAGRYREAAQAYQVAARDSAARRARDLSPGTRAVAVGCPRRR